MYHKKNKSDFFEFIDSNKLESFKYAIFDLDDTLYNYQICNDYAISIILDHFYHEFNIDKKTSLNTYLEARNYINKNLKNTSSMHSRFLYLKKTVEVLALDNSFHNTIKLYDIFWESFFNKMKLFKWVMPVFKKLKKNNIKIVIATDFNARIQFLKIINLSIDSYINEMVTSQEVGEEKPSKKFAKTILNSIEAEKSRIFYVGDNPNKDIFLTNFDVKTFII
tara:strand:- start:20701 stop:21366 length:666 start_codon:yes stop_codon:yes gene_type:complete